MIKIDDVVFIHSKNDSIYQFVDTDPRFINYGVVEFIGNDRYKVRDKNGNVVFVNKDDNSTELITFKEYVKRCNDILYHLKCNAEMAKEIEKGFNKE